MGVRLSVLSEAYTNTAWMCVGIMVFFGVIALLALFLNAKRLNFGFSARAVFWCCGISGFILLAVCLTLIDEPRWDLKHEDRKSVV